MVTDEALYVASFTVEEQWGVVVSYQHPARNGVRVSRRRWGFRTNNLNCVEPVIPEWTYTKVVQVKWTVNERILLSRHLLTALIP